MARLGSAHPRGGSASAQALLPVLGTWLKQTPVTDWSAHERWLQVAAALHLSAIAAAVFVPSSPPLPIFLTITGLALVVLALSRATAQTQLPSAIEISPARANSLNTEIQSQRLVEIANAASRARRESEMRSQLWAELTARMSHELRTPLNAVIGFSDLMNSEMFGPLGHDRYRDYARHIRECSRSLLRSTEDTLALTSSLAKQSAAECTSSLCLVRLLQEAADFHAVEASVRNVEMALSDLSSIAVIGETRPIRQILINLMAEALQRARPGCSVKVAVADELETVSLVIRVAKAIPRPDEGQSSLAICIARVLLEQQNSTLVESDDHDSWQVATYFHRPSQPDFFANSQQVKF